MTINNKITHLLDKIIDAKERFGREKDSISLLLVSKTREASAIREAYECGQPSFGENYLQEALDKQNALRDLDIDWHFIGAIQSNKAMLIGQHFNWVHAVSREKELKLLNQSRQNHPSPLNICLQVNLSNEASKSGLLMEEVEPFCKLASTFKHLKLRGLMAIPKATSEFEQQCQTFHPLNKLYNKLKSQYQFDTLSMGMSNDFIAAIKEGSTLIRVGQAVFGARK